MKRKVLPVCAALVCIANVAYASRPSATHAMASCHEVACSSSSECTYPCNGCFPFPFPGPRCHVF